MRLALVACLGLAACVSTQASVSEFNGDSVKVDVDVFLPTEQQKAIAGAEAKRVCQSAGKSRAEYASHLSEGSQYTSTLLFLCLP